MYSKIFSTSIDFVNSNCTNSGSAQTSDFNYIIISIILFMLILSIAAIVYFFKNKKYKFSFFCKLGVLVLFMAFSSCLLFNSRLIIKNANADETNDEYVKVDVPESISSYLQDNKLNFSEYSIKNISDKETAVIKQIKLSKLNDNIGGIWKITCNNQVIFNNLIDSDFCECNIVLSPNESVVLNISTDFAICTSNFSTNDKIAKIDYNITNPDIVSIQGQTNCIKAINPDQRQVVNDINVKLIDKDTGSSSTVASIDDGSFNFVVRKTGNYQINVDVPGVVPYAQDITINNQENYIDVNLQGLDFYTLDELKTASTLLSNLNSKGEQTLKNSDLYKEFYRYMGSDTQEEVLWYSNSMGRQKNKEALDTNLCNVAYRNNFKVGKNVAKYEIDQYLFLRIMGICHDYKTSNHDEKAGLTFNAVRSLPNEYRYADFNNWNNCWDKDYMNRNGCYVHDALQSGGDIYNTINENFRKNVISVDKPYTKVNGDKDMAWSSDLFFILSYPEIYQYGQSLTYDAPWFYNNDPSGNSTEGYMYEWTDSHKICGNTLETSKYGINKCLKDITKSNSGQRVSELDNMVLRNACPSGLGADIKVHIINNEGDLLSVVVSDEVNISVNLCFCF